MNVLLNLDYKAQKAGTLLTNVSQLDAEALERLGLGVILKDEPEKDEPVKAEPKGKGEKVADA